MALETKGAGAADKKTVSLNLAVDPGKYYEVAMKNGHNEERLRFDSVKDGYEIVFDQVGSHAVSAAARKFD